jgi:hypothetical protein
MCVPPASGRPRGAPGGHHQAKQKAGFPAQIKGGEPGLRPSAACRPGRAYLLGDGDALPLGAGVADGAGAGVVVVPSLVSASTARCSAAASFFC